MSMKTAVILLNLGGPDNLTSVQPFLFNLFNDRFIISLPQPMRWLLAKFISRKRTPKARAIYEKMGGRSSIVPQTQAQAVALEKELSSFGDYKVFITMRYWHPMAPETVAQVKNYNPDRIILLPLYPQFSTTTTASSFRNWAVNASSLGQNLPTIKICCYHSDPNFISAYADLTLNFYNQAAKHGKPRILFSAHGIPLNRVANGDPYQWQVERTVEAVIAKMGIADPDYAICYQSRVGPLKWLQPSTEHELKRTVHDGMPIVLVPISFVSEHSETLVELDIQYKDLVESLGGKHYFRVPTVRTHPQFIKGLALLCQQATDSKCEMNLECCKRMVPAAGLEPARAIKLHGF